MEGGLEPFDFPNRIVAQVANCASAERAASSDQCAQGEEKSRMSPFLPTHS